MPGETIQRAHAIANGVYVAAVNRVGHEGRPKAGWNSGAARSSAIRSAVVLSEASNDKEEILVAECDLAHMEERPAQLALPARPPHRQLWADREPIDRPDRVNDE